MRRPRNTQLVVFLSWASLLAAPWIASGAFRIDVFDDERGLPQNSVFALTQTRDGYLWLGTGRGLVRSDGLKFSVFDESNTPGLSSGSILRLFEDSQERLWVGTETLTALLEHGKLTPLPEIGPSGYQKRLEALCQDTGGSVWLYYAAGELWRYSEGKFTPFLVARGPLGSSRGLIAERGGPIWLGVERRLFAIDPAGSGISLELPVVQEQPVGTVDFLLASANGGYWRLADGRVQKWKTTHLDRDMGAYPWGSTLVSAVCEDKEGNLVVGTRGAGVYWFDATGGASHLSKKDGLSDDLVLSLLIDREGTLWVGTDGNGLNRVTQRLFSLMDASRDLTVQTVSADDSGRGLWVGFNRIEPGASSLLHWDGETAQWFGASQGLSSTSIRSVLQASNRQVWVGTYGGLFTLENGRCERAGGTATIFPIFTIHEARNRQLWVGTQDGLARWDGQSWRKFSLRDGLSGAEVRAVAEDKDGSIWIGTTGGLTKWNESAVVSFHTKDGLPAEKISALYYDRDGVLWVGTEGGGLGPYQNGKWSSYTVRDGLVSNNVSYLLEDEQGYLWIGSNAGLMRVRKASLLEFRPGIAGLDIRTYGKADGLPTRECSFGSQPAAGRTADGRLWFPTIKGLVSISPRNLISNTNPPPVVIESVLVEREEQITNSLAAKLGPIVVPPSREHLEITYTSLNLRAPDRARFRYRLERHETAWTEAQDSRVARYSRLPPGEYRFHVKACNEDGIWNETGSSMAIIVEPPIWRKGWFLILCGLSVLAAIVGIVHYISTQRLQRQLVLLREKEMLEKERARIARDMHDQIGASLTQVSLLGEMLEEDKHQPEEVASHAQQITQTARETTRSLDEIVWTVNPSNDTLEGLVNYLCKHAQDYASVAGLKYRVDIPPTLPPMGISPEVRHNVFLAAKEAVTNVVRHAQATELWIRLRLDTASFTVEIEDNGRGMAGMDRKAAQLRSGLRNMQKRLEELGGSFSITAGAAGGTLVRLTAPIRTT